MKSTTRILVGLGALLVCALLVLITWLPRHEPAATKGLAQDSARDADVQTPELEDADPSQPITPVAIDAVSARTSARAPSAAARSGRITALDALTRRPVVNAVVWIIPMTSVSPIVGVSAVERGFREIGLIAAATRTVPALGRTDESGSLAIPDGEPTDVVIVQAGSLFGLVEWSASGAETDRIVLLHPDSDLRVIVTDKRGAPVEGIRVRVRPAVRGRNIDDESTGVSQPHTGEVLVEHVGWMLATHDPYPWLVSVDGLLATKVEVAIDRAHLGGAPVRLVMPDFGGVIVSVVGAAPAEAQSAYILDASTSAGGKPIHSQRVFSRAGTATFPVVETGLSVKATVRAPGPSGRLEREVPGPVRHGEIVAIDLQDVRRKIVLMGDARQADGSPLPDTKLQVMVTKSEAPHSGFRTTTDRDGSFEIVLAMDDGESHSDGDVWQLALRTDLEDYSSVQPPLAASVRFTPDMSVERQALGEVRFAEQGVLLAGRVEDEAGSAYGGILVTAQEHVPKAESPADKKTATLQKKPSLSLSVMSRSDGTFTIWGVPADVELSVHATNPMRGNEQIQKQRVLAGTSDVVLVVARTGTVVGSVLLDPSVPVDQLVAECTWRDPARVETKTTGAKERSNEDRERERAEIKKQASAIVSRPMTRIAPDRAGFTIEGVPPGTVDFQIRSLQGEILKTVAGLRIEGGATCTDPRLVDIDLRRTVRSIRLTVRRDDGEPVENGDVVWNTNPPGPKWQRAGIVSHVALMIVTAPTVDAVVRVPGCREARLPGLSSDQAVVLAPAIPVQVEVSGTRVPDGYQVRCVLRPFAASDRKPPEGQRLSTPSVGCDPDGRGTALMPAEGKYNATLYLTYPGKPGWQSHLQPDGIADIDVRADTPNVLRFEIGDAEMQRALASGKKP